MLGHVSLKPKWAEMSSNARLPALSMVLALALV